jgi:hypothetical protein
VVLIITEGNRRVESSELNYSPNGDRIWSDSFTVMHEPGRILEGMGFDSDLSFDNATVGPGSIRNTGERPVEAPVADTAGMVLDSAGPGADTLSPADDTLPAVPDTLRALPDTLTSESSPGDSRGGPGRWPRGGGGSTN